MEDFYVAFGRNLKAARRRVNLSQADLAELVSISRPSLANIERGEQRVALHQAVELAAAVGLTLDHMVPKAKVESPAIAMLLKHGVDNDSLIDWVRRAAPQAH